MAKTAASAAKLTPFCWGMWNKFPGAHLHCRPCTRLRLVRAGARRP